MGKLTVICAVYNTAEYLPKCIESILAQERRPDEVLWIDDGSTDASGEILRAACENEPAFHYSYQENAGQAAARNLGLHQATGDVVAFLDSDDWLEPAFFSTLLPCLESEGADLAVAALTDHRADCTVRQLYGHEASPFHLNPSVCNKIFRRSFIENHQLRFPEGLWYEDLAFFHQALLYEPKIAYTMATSYHSLAREGSTMHNENASKNRDILEVVQLVLDRMQAEGKLNLLPQLDFFLADSLLLTAIMRLEAMKNPEKEEVIREIRDFVKRVRPQWYRSPDVHAMPFKRRLVAHLNAWGLSGLSASLIHMKHILKRIPLHGTSR